MTSIQQKLVDTINKRAEYLLDNEALYEHDYEYYGDKCVKVPYTSDDSYILANEKAREELLDEFKESPEDFACQYLDIDNDDDVLGRFVEQNQSKIIEMLNL